MKVTIDGTEYLPASDFSKDADATAKAILRAAISGWYTTVHCHKSGEQVVVPTHCECSGCEMYRVVVQFLGEVPECAEEKDAGFLKLVESIKENQ